MKCKKEKRKKKKEKRKNKKNVFLKMYSKVKN